MTPPSFARFLAPLAFASAAASIAAVASADDPTPSTTATATTAQPVSSCVIKGSQPPPKGTQIYDAVSGGRVIAEATGAVIPLQISELPADPTTGRAKIATSNGAATVRIDGFAAPTAFSVYSVKDVPIYAGHVWISDGQKVKLTSAQASTLTAEITIAGSQSQTAKGTAACDAFALEKGTATTFTVPGNGRGYQMKSTTLDLYDDANGTNVFSLNMLEGTGQLFWSTESKVGFVHVQMRGDLVIDAWAKWSALNPLKKGEMLDQAIPGSSAVGGAQLAFDKTPTLLKATKDIPIRVRRDEKEKTIGTIETGAEFYVMETIVGWANILPKNLGFTAPSDGGFWILSSDVPKS
ncbi:MAG: hypothetical protein U0441_06125 [Polyangiaceae bacterium]